MASMAPGSDAGKAPPLEAAAVKKRNKKSKKGVYRPKIQIDVVFKRSAPPPAKKAATQPKKRYTRKKKAGKDGLALGGEDSVVVGVAGGEDDGAGVSCMEGVVLAGERSVLLPEIGVGIGVEVEKEVEEERVEVEKKAGEEGIEMMKDVEVGMEEDGTPPPKPVAMERRLTRTYLRRNGLNAKRCLDFGLGKSDDQVLPVAEGEAIAVAEARVGEVIVEDEKEAMASSMRKPRTKRARTKRAGLVKLDCANPAEESFHGQSFTQARGQQLLLPNASLPPKLQNAIVLVQESTRPKKPEVLLDEVSRIMWRLTENEGTFDMDVEIEESCKKEWDMFAGRVHKFIAVMHSELGPRSYSKWNGSVLDSVVGVFLTQNVSDNLSSDAFMCLASRFPPQHAINDFDVHDSKEFGCENMHKEGTNDNGTRPSCHKVCFNVDGNLKTKTKEVCGLSEKFQGSSIKKYENLEQKATSSNISIVLEGKTTISEQDDRESNTASFNGKDERRILPNKGKEEAAKENFVDDKKNEKIHWDALRQEACRNYPNQQRTLETLDSVDYASLRNATVEDVASAIKIRGMNNRIAARIQDLLNKLDELHGRLDLEWLRFTPQDKVQEYLLHFNGLGMKSVECVRLLTLQHQAFPVDINVARICVRLGWVPLKPLPQFIRLHVLDKYPDMNKIQQYLWPRLRRLDPQTLYELHYQMITFGKVFCTKNRPNCKACPLKEDCRHYASACASEKLALPSSEEKQQSPQKVHKLFKTMLLETICDEDSSRPSVLEPAKYYVTFPDADDDELIGDSSQCVGTTESASGLQDQQTANGPDDFVDDIEDFPGSLKTLADLKDIHFSNALVPLTLEAASTLQPKLKKLTRLRTEHYVYELPDDHPLLANLEPRVANDSNPYLLAIWVAGETAETIQTSTEPCSIRKSRGLCDEVTCFDCNNVREGKTQSTRGTFLVPCRTATRGRFPLNGTYFQINEVFADDETSRQPIDVPRNLLWNLQRRMVHFGSTITTLSRGFSRKEVRNLFSKDYICLRGFDRSTRFPKPLFPRFHCPVHKMKSTKPRKSSGNDNG